MNPGEAVAVLREQRGLSRSALAAATGLHKTVLYKIERGRRPISLKAGVRLARALGVHPAEIVFAGYEEPQE